MHWASAYSERPGLNDAVEQAVGALRQRLDDADLLIAFVSPHHASGYDRLGALLRRYFPRATLIGASAAGVIGAGRELEQGSVLALSAARLPGVTVTPFHLGAAALGAAPDWSRLIGVAAERRPQFLLFADPYSFNVEPLLGAIDRLYPGSAALGGLASGARAEGGHALLLNETLYRFGLTGVALHGNVRLDTLVAQGCRPVGPPLFVTAAGRARIRTLDGRPPLEILRDVFATLDERDQMLFRRSLFLGVLPNGAGAAGADRGEYLIRSIAGIDSAGGALAVGADVAVNSVVRLHLRDAQTSAADLSALLERRSAQLLARRPAGALLFSCLGRGARLYGKPDHDSRLFAKYFASLPLAGFFANGEIGPVNGRSSLHSYTSAFGIFSPAES